MSRKRPKVKVGQLVTFDRSDSVLVWTLFPDDDNKGYLTVSVNPSMLALVLEKRKLQRVNTCYVRVLTDDGKMFGWVWERIVTTIPTKHR